MSGIALIITMDKPDKTYEGGETITGQVQVTVAEKIQAAALVLVLYCKGYSEKKTCIAGSYIGKDNDVKAEQNIILVPGAKRTSQDQGGKGAKEVVYRESARSLKGFFVFSLALSLIGIFVGWRNSPFGETEEDVMGVFFFGGVIPLLLGLAVLFCATYQALVNKRIKKAEVRLGSGQARPGGKIPCSVTFEANIPFEVNKVSAVLKAEEIVDLRDHSSKGGKLSTYVLYENKQELTLAVKKIPTKVPIRVEGEVLIPEGVPCSIDLMESREGMAIKWDIEFAIEMKKWPDWVHIEDITVHP